MKKIITMLIVMMFIATSVFAVNITVGTESTIASAAVASVATYTCATTAGMRLSLTVGTASSSGVLWISSSGPVEIGTSTSVLAGGTVAYRLASGSSIQMIASPSVSSVALSGLALDHDIAVPGTTTATSTAAYTTFVNTGTETFRIVCNPVGSTASDVITAKLNGTATVSLYTAVAPAGHISFSVATGSHAAVYSTSKVPITITALKNVYTLSGAGTSAIVPTYSSTTLTNNSTDTMNILIDGSSVVSNGFKVIKNSALASTQDAMSAGSNRSFVMKPSDYLTFLVDGAARIESFPVTASVFATSTSLLNRAPPVTLVASEILRTMSFQNTAPRRLKVEVVDTGTVFLSIGGTASTSSSLFVNSANPLNTLVPSGYTVTFVATQPVELSVRTFPIGTRNFDAGSVEVNFSR